MMSAQSTAAWREPSLPAQALAALLPESADAAVADCLVTGLQQDSRMVAPGDLFLACAGGREHGLQYLAQAKQRGAVAVAWEAAAGQQAPTLLPAVEVENLTAEMGAIAARFYAQPSRDLFVVGITGTDGKTSCAWILAQALERLNQHCGYLGTLGYGFVDDMPTSMLPASHTTPDAVRLQYWLAKLKANDAQAVALEVSSHALHQGRANGVGFDVAVLTNIGRDHLDYHGDVASYAAAKKKLFEQAGLRAAILNQDDTYGREWMTQLPAGVAAIGYGVGQQPAPQADRTLLATAVKTHAQGLSLELDGAWGRGQLHSSLLGRFNAYNLLACLAVLLEQGYALAEATAALAKVPTVPGRMQAITAADTQPLAVVDYAHTPQALEQALLAARAHCTGQLICVFGCGGERDRGKRPLMAVAAAKHADRIVVTDDNPRGESPAQIVGEILAGLTAATDYRVEHDRAMAIDLAIREAGAGDVVLIAGKGHETYQLVGSERLAFSDQLAAQQALGQAA